METRFVFVVGARRSGTTLMRRILNKSDQVALCDENHFLGHVIPTEGVRYKFRQFGDLSDDDNVRKLIDYIYDGGLEQSFKRLRWWSYHWKWIVAWVDREDLLQRILASDRSERALFVVMMQVFADRQGKPIMGEKTPIHFRYVPTLMEWFPDGKVVHMLRDPRAIFVSELRTRRQEAITFPFKQLRRFGFLFELYIVVQTTAMWFESTIRSRKYEKTYPNTYCVVKFEDLVSDPGKSVRQICDFLDVSFQDKMLEQTVVSKGAQLGQAGFDKGAAIRWKECIAPWINAWFSFWFRGYLKEFGYAN
jgi:hypothetical protein